MQLVFHRHSLILCSASTCFGVILTLPLFHLQSSNHFRWMENKIALTHYWITTTILRLWGIRPLPMTIRSTTHMLTFTLQQHLIMTIGIKCYFTHSDRTSFLEIYDTLVIGQKFIFDIRLYFFSPSRDGGNFQESICTNEDDHHNDDDPAMLMVGGNRNDGSAIFGFDHVKEFCVRYLICKKGIHIHYRILLRII